MFQSATVLFKSKIVYHVSLEKISLMAIHSFYHAATTNGQAYYVAEWKSGRTIQVQNKIV